MSECLSLRERVSLGGASFHVFWVLGGLALVGWLAISPQTAHAGASCTHIGKTYVDTASRCDVLTGQLHVCQSGTWTLANKCQFGCYELNGTGRCKCQQIYPKPSVCLKGERCLSYNGTPTCLPSNWCPYQAATKTSLCAVSGVDKMCVKQRCEEWDCTSDIHCPNGQFCANHKCANMACAYSNTEGIYSQTCSNKASDKPYCAKYQCRACRYGSTTGLAKRTPECDPNDPKRPSTTPFCAGYECVQCQHKAYTQDSTCQQINGSLTHCKDYKCVECSAVFNKSDPKCGGSPCVNFRCAECKNASKTASPDSACQTNSPGRPFCKEYRCVACDTPNQLSTKCQTKDKTRPYCNAANICVQCLGTGLSSVCKASTGFDYCFDGRCRECDSDAMSENNKGCVAKYGNKKPHCYQHQCVECGNQTAVGQYDRDTCIKKYASTAPLKRYCANRTCVECPSAAKTKTNACTPDKPICQNYTCHQCVDNGDCPIGENCVANKCQKPDQKCGTCKDDSWCYQNMTTGAKCGAGKLRCHPKSGVCVQCLIDTDCKAGETCDPKNSVCVKSNCPSFCNTNMDCMKSDCGTRTSCINHKCTTVGGGTNCVQPNIVLMTDRSCSMRTNLVDTRQPCSRKSDCTSYFASLVPSYTPYYTSNTQLRCKRSSTSSQNTCWATRWDVAMAGLRKVIGDYGGTAPSYQDRKVRWSKMFFGSSAFIPGSSPTLARWGGISDIPNTKFILDDMDSRSASGGTYYVKAFKLIESHLKTALAADAVPNRKTAVIFTTDGAPSDSCGGAETIIKRLYNMKDKNGEQRKIKTFIVGFGSGLSSSGKACLARLAKAGQTEVKSCSSSTCLSYYAADSAADLSNALQDIVNQATQEVCDGLDNDCDGLIDNNTVDACSCVMSFSRPTPSTAVPSNSFDYKTGVRLYTFSASFDVQGTCPASGTPADKRIKQYRESCRNNSLQATSCDGNKKNGVHPAGDAYKFYCSRCCGSGTGRCSWPSSHACASRPWGGSCNTGCTSFCEANKRAATDCAMPRGILMRSGTGYDLKGKLTVLSVKDFGADALDKQQKRHLFVHIPGCDYRLQADAEKRPLVADIQPDSFDAPTLNGIKNAATSWSSPGSGCVPSHAFAANNKQLTIERLGINARYCDSSKCEEDRKQTIWFILGYDNNGKSMRTSRLGAIYHSTPQVVPPVTTTIPEPGFGAWVERPLGTGGSFKNKTVRDRPSMVYVGTADGVLHAFNSTTGTEVWGYIPRYFLEQGQRLVKSALPSQNNKNSALHYGDTLREAVNGQKVDHTRAHLFDGSPMVKDIQTYRFVDGGVKTCPNGQQGPICSRWRTVLIAGLRAGGRAYVALDITNPYKPRLLWEISHESKLNPFDASAKASRFSLLGLSYGQAYIGNVLIDPTKVPGLAGRLKSTTPQERAIAFLPGGVKLKRPNEKWDIDFASTQGSVVYAVDVETGIHVATIRSFDTAAGITASRARGVAAAPIGYNVAPALTNRLFFGDIMGRLFRVDMTSQNPADWKAKLFYNLYEKESGSHPIMTQPTLSVNTKGELVLFGGTGNLQDVDHTSIFSNKIFSIREVFVSPGSLAVQAVPNYVAHLNKFLANELADSIGKTGPETSVPSDAPKDIGKWTATTGERLTGPPVVFGGTAYFTTYIPQAKAAVCGVSGYSRLYGIHYNDACRGENCGVLANASSGTPATHAYHQTKAYVEDSLPHKRTPVKGCLKNSRDVNASDQTAATNAQLMTGRCNDLHYTMPMLADSDTSNTAGAPYEYLRYLALGENTLSLGVTFSYQPPEVEIARGQSNHKGAYHKYQVKRPGKQFLTFQVAGKSPATNANWRLEKLRAVGIPPQSLQRGAVTTVNVHDAASIVKLFSWGLVLD